MGKNNKQNDSYKRLPYSKVEKNMFNAIWRSALGYLHHVENSYNYELNPFNIDVGNNWYFIHHNSMIAVELFLKSLSCKYEYVKIDKILLKKHGYQFDFDVFETKYHAPYGHGNLMNNIHPSLIDTLKTYLNTDEYELILLSDNSEFTRGRYPYEQFLNRISKDDALKWLSLAQKLSKFEYIV